MPSDRRHSVSGDHRHHRPSHRDDYGRDRDSTYVSRDEDYPRGRHRHGEYEDPYTPRRTASRPTRVSSPRRASPDRNPAYNDRTRGRRRYNDDNDDDYDPRDKYYLSGDQSAGWRSKSQPRPSAHNAREGDDYFGSRHHRSPSRREPPRHSSPRRKSHSHHRHHHDDDDEDRRHHHQHRHHRDDQDDDHHQAPRGRRGAPPMPRRQSSSAPPPSSRKYPPSASQNRHRGHGGSSSSKYPPNAADNRKKGRSMSLGGESKGKDRNGEGGRCRSRSKAGGGGAFGDIPWSAAARCALEAGTMAALKAHNQPGQWIGTKGAQVATAAVGAALVDGFIANKKPGIRGGKRQAVLRQVTHAALSNLVMNPVGKTAEEKKPQMQNLGRNFARNMGSPMHRRKR